MRVEAIVEKRVSVCLQDMTPKQLEYFRAFFQNPVCDPSQEDPEINELRREIWEKLCPPGVGGVV